MTKRMVPRPLRLIAEPGFSSWPSSSREFSSLQDQHRSWKLQFETTALYIMLKSLTFFVYRFP